MSDTSTFPAIVLKSYETGNTSEVVHIFSGLHGRLSVYARGLRTPKNRYRGVLQPLALVEFTLILKDGADMGTLKEAAILSSQEEIVGDFERLTLGLLLAEAAALSAEPAQPSQELFAALLEAFTLLDPWAGTPATAAACVGMRRLLTAAGYEPTIESDLLKAWPEDRPRPDRFWLDRETATIHGRGPAGGGAGEWPQRVAYDSPRFPLPPAAVRFLYELMRHRDPPPLETSHALQLLEGLVRVFEYHLESPLRSAAFYREVFWAD